jgi:glycosyltransferase involved in cell wall biosynthesis
VRIGYVITRADAVGGASVHVRDMARFMIERGHHAMVFVGGAGPVTEQLAAAGVPFHSLRFLLRSIHPVRDLRAVSELADAIRGFQPDILSLHTAKAGWVGRIIASHMRLPALYTPHGWAFGDRFPLVSRSVFRTIEKAVSRHAAAILCVCEHEKDLAVRLGVAEPGHLRVVHNGVHDIAANFLADPEQDPVRIVSVARFQAPKDHATLLFALAMIRDRPWELDLVGDGPEEGALRRLASRVGIADRIQFLGYRPNPAAELGRAQIFALATRSEGFPRSVLEAMRAGLPVVCSRVGGVPEAITDSVDGLLVPHGDPGALAAALAQLLEDRDLRLQIGLQARRTYEARFRFERMAEELLSVYNEFS